MLLSGLLLHSLLNLLSYSTQEYQTKCGTTHGDLGPQNTSVTNQENAPGTGLLWASGAVS